MVRQKAKVGSAPRFTGYGILVALGLITIWLLVQQSRFNPAVSVALRAPLQGKSQAVSGQTPSATLIPETGSSGTRLTLDSPLERRGLPAEGAQMDIVVRLSRPFVDAAKCIGCGRCEHEGPVSGQHAIRVYGDNESRSRPGRMLI